MMKIKSHISLKRKESREDAVRTIIFNQKSFMLRMFPLIACGPYGCSCTLKDEESQQQVVSKIAQLSEEERVKRGCCK